MAQALGRRSLGAERGANGFLWLARPSVLFFFWKPEAWFVKHLVFQTRFPETRTTKWAGTLEKGILLWVCVF